MSGVVCFDGSPHSRISKADLPASLLIAGNFLPFRLKTSPKKTIGIVIFCGLFKVISNLRWSAAGTSLAPFSFSGQAAAWGRETLEALKRERRCPILAFNPTIFLGSFDKLTTGSGSMDG
jgi:hypothetical protein